jgi:hypothetical protein
MNITKTISDPRRVLPALNLLLAALCLGACSFSPAPVIEYRAQTPDAIWNNGIELHPSRTSRLDIRTGFLEYSTDYVLGQTGPRPLFFRITAENRSSKDVLVDPGDFRILIPCGDSVLASIDPEAVIHHARTEQAAEDARSAGRLATNAVMQLGEVVLDIATLFADKDPEQEREWKESKERTREMKEDEEQRHRERTVEITARSAFWSDSALRKTTLPPGGSMRGRIGFAMEPNTTPSDSLLLQYREGDGRQVDLVTYGLIPEHAPVTGTAKTAAGSKPALSDPPPASAAAIGHPGQAAAHRQP